MSRINCIIGPNCSGSPHKDVVEPLTPSQGVVSVSDLEVVRGDRF